jgi:hypothetical protein
MEKISLIMIPKSTRVGYSRDSVRLGITILGEANGRSLKDLCPAPHISIYAIINKNKKYSPKIFSRDAYIKNDAFIS